MEDIRTITGRDVQLVVATSGDIERTIDASSSLLMSGEAGRERPVVDSTGVGHVHSLRPEDQTIPTKDPELARLFALATDFVRAALDGLSQDLLEPHLPRSTAEMIALFDPEANWPLAQVALDVLGTHLADEFGAMRLSAPTEFESRILLRLHVSVPTPAVHDLLPRLRAAMEGMIREVVGFDTSAGFDVRLAASSDV